MKPKQRTYADGVQKGLSIALGIVKRAPAIGTARADLTTVLLAVVEVTDEDTLAAMGIEPSKLLTSRARERAGACASQRETHSSLPPQLGQ